MEIDGERLLADLEALRAIGRDGTGVHRPAFSADDIRARHWVRARMAEAGLETAIDAIGNVRGRSRHPGPAVLIGSHTDTVPHGGWLDGALGVAYGLEIARSFAEDPATRDLAIDVVDFQDEEGTHMAFLGSRAFCGEIGMETIAAAPAADGGTLGEVIARADLPKGPLLTLERERTRAFLEAHIEQGPRLEGGGVDIGVARAVVGIRRSILRFSGRADHAGTTPMALRKDAGRAAIALAHALDAAFRDIAASDTVWNFGRLGVTPGALNVVPTTAELGVEFRDVDAARLARMERTLADLVAARDGEGGVGIAVEPRESVAPVALDGEIAAAMTRAAEAAGASSLAMPSGAGHDAMILQARVPAGLLFIPSIDARSHSTEENSHPADIVRGCAVLARTALALLGR